MKAPDVIYLAESDKVKGEVSANFASENPFKTHTSIAYIRKEALLEWISTSKNSLLMDTKAPHLGKVGSLATLDALTDMLSKM